MYVSSVYVEGATTLLSIGLDRGSEISRREKPAAGPVLASNLFTVRTMYGHGIAAAAIRMQTLPHINPATKNKRLVHMHTLKYPLLPRHRSVLRSEDNAFTDFLTMVVSPRAVPSHDIDVVLLARGTDEGWEGECDNNASGETDIDYPRSKQVRIDEPAVYVVNVVIEKPAAVLEIWLIPMYMGDREDSIVPLVLIPISGVYVVCDPFGTANDAHLWLYMAPEPCPYIRYH